MYSWSSTSMSLVRSTVKMTKPSLWTMLNTWRSSLDKPSWWFIYGSISATTWTYLTRQDLSTIEVNWRKYGLRISTYPSVGWVIVISLRWCALLMMRRAWICWLRHYVNRSELRRLSIGATRTRLETDTRVCRVSTPQSETRWLSASMDDLAR